MSSEHIATPEITIHPLPFWPIYESAGDLLSSMLEQDIMFQEWLGHSGVLRALARGFFMPLYYHMITSGFGAFIGGELAGWLYLRGWRQILYIETLATRPACRRRGVGDALMSFAEHQAHVLHRQWLGLTVTAANEPAVRLYEKNGYRRAHWRIMQCNKEIGFPPSGNRAVHLQPVFGVAAWQAYRHFTAADLAAGEGWAAPASTRLFELDLHRRPGREWLVVVDDRVVAYLNKHGSFSCPNLYLACGRDWWADPCLLQAVMVALNDGAPLSRSITLRLASSGHHDAALPLLSEMGFETRPACMFKMFKEVSDAAGDVSQPRSKAP